MADEQTRPMQPGTGQQLLAAQARMEAKIDAVLKAIAELKASRAVGGGDPEHQRPPTVATDAELDGPHGNPTIKKDPPKWTGISYADASYSQCTPEYLLNLAGFLEWLANTKDTKAAAGDELAAKKAYLDRLDAARARGWAKRNEGKNGVRPPASQASLPNYGPDDDGRMF